MSEVFYNQIGTDGGEEKFYNWKIYCCKFTLILSPSAANEKFNSIGSRLAAPKFSSARAARLFFVIQPIKFLICSVVVAVDIRNLIGWMEKNYRAERAARTLVQYLDVACQKQREIFVPIKWKDTSPISNNMTNTK